MSKSRTKKLEKHIYVEQRCGAYRLVVAVTPFPRQTATFSTLEEGAQWARRQRVQLLEKKQGQTTTASDGVCTREPDVSVTPSSQANSPENISVAEMLASYAETELDRLAGKQAEASRLNRLKGWFGHLTFGQLDAKCLKKWKAQRLSGLLGSGRNPNRAQTGLPGEDGKPLTKHQRYWRKKKAGNTALGQSAQGIVYPVSTQTIRHEIVLLRRAVQTYFDQEGLMLAHGMWLQAHYLMRMPLPAKAEPRDRRLSDEEVVAIIGELGTPDMRAAVLFALLTTLRCSEIVSLRWEHLDLRRSIVRLTRPGYLEKKKTHERDVPLLPGALKVLTDLGIQKSGPIFPVTASGLSQAWRRAADRAGILDARLHDCRREAISRLIETCKLGLHNVVVFSGHSDIATLQRHYVRLNPERIATELAQLPAAHAMLPSL